MMVIFNLNPFEEMERLHRQMSRLMQGNFLDIIIWQKRLMNHVIMG